jgi:CRP/FNR family cyclic AMP-dependent transcriptional regulator
MDVTSPEAFLPLDLSRVPECVRTLPGVVRRLPAGALLMSEGWCRSNLFVVLSGGLSLSRTSPSGGRATIEMLFAGDVFGLVPGSTGSNAPQAESGTEPDPLAEGQPEARTLVPSLVLWLDPVAIPHERARDPASSTWLAAALARRLDRMGRRFARCLTMPVEERLLATLSDLAERAGRPLSKPAGATVVDLPLQQDLLASMIGATRESTNRAIRSLRSNGRIERVGSRYILAAPPGPPRSESLALSAPLSAAPAGAP